MRPGLLGGLLGGLRRASQPPTEAASAAPESDETSKALSRQLALAAAQAREEEWRRMAVDLHDGPVQQLVNLVLRLEMAEKALPEDAQQARAEYAALRQFARDILTDLRRFMSELRPASLEEFSLLPVLRQYLQDFRKEYSIEVDLQLQDADWRLGREAELSLFRVIQEALTNVRKHAHASRVVIRLGRKDGVVWAEIADDGKGFDLAAARLRAREEKRLGLTSMEDRVQALGGTLTVESSSQGTTVRASIPVPEEKMAVTDGTDTRADRG